MYDASARLLAKSVGIKPTETTDVPLGINGMYVFVIYLDNPRYKPIVVKQIFI